MMIAAGTLITCIVVTIAIQLAKSSRSTSLAFEKSLSAIDQDLAVSDITMYDGLEVCGSDVVNFIKRELSKYSDRDQGPMKITVVTLQSPYVEYSYYNGNYIEDIQNFTSERYIHPLHKYRGTIIYNENEVIAEIIFTIQ